MAEEKKKDRGKWFREMKSELKKVVWPTGKDTAKNTGTVLLCSLCVGACIWIFDAVAGGIVDALLQGDGERAATEVLEHLHNSEDGYRRMMLEDAPDMIQMY